MSKFKIAVQRGLTEISNLLSINGFEICDLSNSKDADITIINVADFEYEGISASECRIYGDNKMLLINSANYSPEEILKIIAKNSCNCVH